MNVETTAVITAPAEKEADKFDKGLRDALKVAASTWRDRYLRGHFSPSAEAKYGYASRSWRYWRRKQAIFKHRVPLVYTGNARRQITTVFKPPRSKRTSTGWQARLNLEAPKYFYQQRGNAPDKVDEVTRMTEPEHKNILGVIESELDKAIGDAAAAQIERITI